MLGSSSTSSTVGIKFPFIGFSLRKHQREKRTLQFLSNVLGLQSLDRGKLDDETREFSFFAFDCNRPAEITNDTEANAQPETGPASFAARREERIEDFIQVFAFDSHAVVVKLDADELAVFTSPPRANPKHFA